MPSENYTIKETITAMESRQIKRLDEILEQVKKTNGCVLELERWRAYLTGAVALALALGLPNMVALTSGL